MTEREWLNLLDMVVWFWPIAAWVVVIMVVAAIVLDIWMIALSILRKV